MPRYNVNKMVQELFSDPANLQQLAGEPERLFDRYELTAAERAALQEGSPDALTRAGMHPILQMHYMLASNPEVAKAITVRAYADRFARA